MKGPGLETEKLPGVSQAGGKWPVRYVFFCKSTLTSQHFAINDFSFSGCNNFAFSTLANWAKITFIGNIAERAKIKNNGLRYSGSISAKKAGLSFPIVVRRKVNFNLVKL